MSTIEFKLGGTLKFVVDDEPEARPGAIVTLSYDGFSITVRNVQMAYVLPIDKAVKVKVAYVDAGGHPARVDGDVVWASSNETIAKVLVDADDTSNAVVTPSHDLGQVQIRATADADLGEGVKSLITVMDVEIVGGEAVAGTITPVGEPGPIQPEQR